MHEDFHFSDYPYLEIENFGVLHLNIDEAAELISKILFLKRALEVEVPDKEEGYSLKDPNLIDLLSKQIEEYRGHLISGINRGTLNTVRIRRNIDERILTAETFVNVNVLVEWLEQRNVDITGDWFSEYYYSEIRVAEAAVHAIQVERTKIKIGEKKNSRESKDETIIRLEKKLMRLEGKFSDTNKSKLALKPLHTKEKETLMKLVIGMAVDGYGYDPSASRSPISKELSDNLALKGIRIDADTVRKWLKEASESLPHEFENPNP